MKKRKRSKPNPHGVCDLKGNEEKRCLAESADERRKIMKTSLRKFAPSAGDFVRADNTDERREEKSVSQKARKTRNCRIASLTSHIIRYGKPQAYHKKSERYFLGSSEWEWHRRSWNKTKHLYK